MSVYKKLLQIEKELLANYDSDDVVANESHLIKTLVDQEGINTLIVNLYPGLEGYSLTLTRPDGSQVETAKLPYEESEFLNFLDLRQLPPMLLNVVTQSKLDLFYEGCIFIELRDFRRCLAQKNYDTCYLLLSPTSETIVHDVNKITHGDPQWTDEDKLKLEAKLITACKPHLHLEPTPCSINRIARAQCTSRRLNSQSIKRSLRKFSPSYQKRAAFGSYHTSPSPLRLLDFISRNRDRKPVHGFMPKANQNSHLTDMWKQRTLPLEAPAVIDVGNYAKVHDYPKYTTDNTPEKVQEVILEGERTNSRPYYCKVTISRRSSTGEYIGDLYLEELRSAEDETGKDGRSCRFTLGTRAAAQRYLQQFQEMYVEERKKPVKISTFVASQQHVQHVSAFGQQESSTALASTSGDGTATANGIAVAAGSSTDAVGLSVKLATNVKRERSMLSSGSSHQPLIVGGTATISNTSGGVQGRTVGLNQSTDNSATAQGTGTQLTTTYIQPIQSGSSTGGSTLTGVPISLQGANVNIVPATINAQFIANSNHKTAQQNVRNVTTSSIAMLQTTNVAAPTLHVGQQRIPTQFAVPSGLVPISQMTRITANSTTSKGQQIQTNPAMASVLVHGKQVMVQGQSAFLSGQAAHIIPGQTTVLPGGQTAIIQGGSIFLQGQPGQASIVAGGQGHGQTLMIQSNQGNTGQQIHGKAANAQSVAGYSLQGQTLFIQGAPTQVTAGPLIRGQAIVVQSQGQQGQLSIISTSLPQTTATAHTPLQIVTQPSIQSDDVQHGSTLNASTSNAPTALSALTSQVNLLPVQTSQPQQQFQVSQVMQFSTQPNQQRQPPKRKATGQAQPQATSNKRKPSTSTKH